MKILRDHYRDNRLALKKLTPAMFEKFNITLKVKSVLDLRKGDGRHWEWKVELNKGWGIWWMLSLNMPKEARQMMIDFLKNNLNKEGPRVMENTEGDVRVVRQVGTGYRGWIGRKAQKGKEKKQKGNH